MKKAIENIKIIYKKIYDFGQLCKMNHLDSHSAAAAFFMFVSIIPFIILILAIIPFTPISDSTIISVAKFFLPARFDNYAIDILQQLTNESINAIWISAVVAMWTASRSLLTIKQGLNEIRGVTETRNFIILRVNAAFYTIILILSFVLMLTLNVIFTAIERYFSSVLGIAISEKYDFVYLIITLRPLITIVIAFLLSLYLFKFLPNHKVTFKSQVPGAVFVSFVWYLFSTLFGIYINYYNAYSMYGSLAIVIIVLFWLYACMYILFIGGQFNYYLSLVKENDNI